MQAVSLGLTVQMLLLRTATTRGDSSWAELDLKTLSSIVVPPFSRETKIEATHTSLRRLKGQSGLFEDAR